MINTKLFVTVTELTFIATFGLISPSFSSALNPIQNNNQLLKIFNDDHFSYVAVLPKDDRIADNRDDDDNNDRDGDDNNDRDGDDNNDRDGDDNNDRDGDDNNDRDGDDNNNESS